MYANVLEQQIKKELPKALFLYGSSPYMLDFYIEYYIEKLDAKSDALKLYFDEWDFSVAKAYLSQSSLFGGTNLLIIKHNKSVPKKELEELIKYTQTSDNSYILYCGYYEDFKDAKSIEPLFNDKNGSIKVRFFEPSLNEAIKILTQKAQSLGTQIEQHAISHLLILLNNNVALCVSELEKLSILDRVVSEKDIDYLVHSNAPLSVDSMIIDLFNKKPFMDRLFTLLELGNEIGDIMRVLEKFVNELLMFQAYIKLNGSVNALEILGYSPPPQILNAKSSMANAIKSSTLLKIFEIILELGMEIRTTPNPQKETLLFATMIKIQSLL
jgi:DNA polymerase-3 subunit delta